MALTVAAPRTGPCTPWATADTVSALGIGLDELNQDILALHLELASEVLFYKSGQQYPGTCSETVRPCCAAEMFGGYSPALVNGQWYNLTGCDSPCVPWACGHTVPKVDLGQYPVVEVTAVKVDGAVLVQSAYRLDDWRFLVRTDGALWPVDQDLTKPDSAVGTWSVQIKYGPPPPRMGVTAAAVLAAEMTKHSQGEKCDLPLRVTSISRQGVSYSLPDVIDILDRGKTGLYLVDLFLDSVNPDKLRRPPRVASLDRMPPRRLGSA